MQFPDYRMKGFVRNALRGDVPDEILDRRDKTYMRPLVRGDGRWTTPRVRHWVSKGDFRMRESTTRAFGEELERETMPLPHYLWARDLAAVHAFIDLWS